VAHVYYLAYEGPTKFQTPPNKLTAVFDNECFRTAAIYSFEISEEKEMTDSFTKALFEYPVEKSKEFCDIVLSIVAQHKKIQSSNASI